MPAFTWFAYDKSGSVIACADDAELLIYAGSDEHPMWRHAAKAPIAGVGTTPGEVVAVDVQGRVMRFEATRGAPLPGVELGAAARGISVAREGTCAVLLENEVAVVQGGRVAKRVPAPGATAVAIRDDGSQVAVGASSGRVQTIEVRAGTGGGQCELGAEVKSVCWSALGFWLCAAGERVFRVEPAGGSSSSLARTGSQQVACSADGGLIACQTALGEVKVLALPDCAVVGTVAYADRSVAGLAFGPDTWLGVGLDRGDGNKINLATGACHRTDTHPGRSHNSWALDVQVDKDRVRMGRSTANPNRGDVQAKIAERARSFQPGGGGGAVIKVVALVIVVLGALLGAGFLASRCG